MTRWAREFASGGAQFGRVACELGVLTGLGPHRQELCERGDEGGLSGEFAQVIC